MNALPESLLQFAITLREGVEIALILAIVFAFLTRTGRQSQFRAVWAGVGFASGICIAAGVVVFSLFGKLSGTQAAISEGVVMVLATGVITWMIFWMCTNARAIKGELHGGLASATSGLAVALFAAMAVLREGFETVMILLSAGAASSSPIVTFGSSFLGFAAATWIGVAIYRRGSRLDLQKFFRYTGVALIAFAAYSLAYGLHEFAEVAPAGGTLIAFGAYTASAAYVGLMLRWFLRTPTPRQLDTGGTVAAAATPAPTKVGAGTVSA